MMQLKGEIKYCEFEPLGLLCSMSEFANNVDLNEDMLTVTYGEQPLWWLFVGWWPYGEDHPLFGEADGHFLVNASRTSDKFHYASISWEARSLEELWPALQLIDDWLASRVS